MVKKVNKSKVLKRAWKLYKSQELRTMEQFSICMKNAWNYEKNGGNIDIDTIYQKYKRLILFRVNTKINDLEISEEITNDVFLKYHEHINNYDASKGKVVTLLYTIASRKVIDYYRMKKSPTISVSDFVNDNGTEIIQLPTNDSDTIDNAELGSSIMNAMDMLKPKYRTIIDLSIIQEKSYIEIAEIMQIPMGSVGAMITRAKAQLQKSLVSCVG